MMQKAVSKDKLLLDQVKTFLHDEWVIFHEKYPLSVCLFGLDKDRDEVYIYPEGEQDNYLALIPVVWVQEHFSLPAVQIRSMFL